MKFDRISRAVRALATVDVEKCSAAVQEEGVTRIPGAAVHVGLIDSRRRCARVTRHQLQCCTHAHARASEHEGRFRFEFRLENTRERGGREILA